MKMELEVWNHKYIAISQIKGTYEVKLCLV